MATDQPESQIDFDELVATHRRALLGYAIRLAGGDVARAEDIVQETFVRAWRSLDRMSEKHGSVGGWLRRVAYNISVDEHRRRRARPTEVELEDLNVAVRNDDTDNVLREIVVEKVLGAIWPEHRAVLVEVYFNDRTSAQTAEVLGIPVGTVKSRLHYALRALQDPALHDGLRAS